MFEKKGALHKYSAAAVTQFVSGHGIESRDPGIRNSIRRNPEKRSTNLSTAVEMLKRYKSRPKIVRSIPYRIFYKKISYFKFKFRILYNGSVANLKIVNVSNALLNYF